MMENTIVDVSDILMNHEQTDNNCAAIGCCHLYRECSLAKKCVSSNKDTSQACLYHKHLKAGRIFYTKNANDFDMKKYEDLAERYIRVSMDSKLVMDYMLYFFVLDKRGQTRECFKRNPHIDSLTRQGLLHEENRAPYAHFDMFPVAYLQKFIANEGTYAKYRKAFWDEHPEYGKSKRKPLMEYMLSKDYRAVDSLYREYVFIVLESEMFKYYEELSHDYKIYDEVVRDDYNRYMYRLLPRSTKTIKTEFLNRCKDLVANSPFYGKKFVITGALHYDRDRALSLIQEFGGATSNSAIDSMDCLVVGYQEWSAMNDGIPSAKIKKAAELIEAGHDVKIISEDEFYKMIDICKSFYNDKP